MPFAVAAGVGAAGSIASGIIESNAAGSAANEQEQAAQQIQALIANLFGQAKGIESPYLNLGSTSAGELGSLLGPNGYLSTPWAPTPQNLAATPGYQFTLNQGLQATQNGFAAQGLGSSGAAIKGAGQYATGLANNTWQQQWQQVLQQKQQISQALLGGTSVGAGAANALTQIIPGIAQGEGSAIGAGAAAGAAGTVGQANALTGAIGGVSQNLLLGGLLSGAFGGTGGGLYSASTPGSYNTTQYNQLSPTVPALSS
jgi:hypothetical protein